MKDYDTSFGELIEPQINSSGISVYEWEKDFSPLSLTVLNRNSAKQLKNFMDDIRAGFRTGSLLANDTILIWIVDEHGTVLFAIEEMFFEGAPAGRPKFQSFKPTLGIPKLGHPSLLVAASKGRIGGEIYFDGYSRYPHWIINNYSGRYGRHAGRKHSHLRNVANKFRDHGIELKVEFE